MNHALSKLLHSNLQPFCPQEGFGVIDMAEWTMKGTPLLEIGLPSAIGCTKGM
jgi:hypothetical protein